MQLTRLSTLALLAFAGVAFQAATAVPTQHQASGVQQASSQEQVSSGTNAAQDSSAATPFTQVFGICATCLREPKVGQAIFVPDCGHFAHDECMKQMPTDKRGKCPFCRAERAWGNVDKHGQSLHFVPATKKSLNPVLQRFEYLLDNIADSPKDVCDNKPSTTDGWSCFADDKKIYITEAVLDKVVPYITGATRTGCASKEVAPDAGLFSTISLPGDRDWGKISVEVQCVDQTSPQGVAHLADYPDVAMPRDDSASVALTPVPLIESVEMFTVANYRGSKDAAAEALAARYLAALEQPERCATVYVLGKKGKLCPQEVRYLATRKVFGASVLKIDQRLPDGFTSGADLGSKRWELPGYSGDMSKFIKLYWKGDEAYFFVVEDSDWDPSYE